MTAYSEALEAAREAAFKAAQKTTMDGEYVSLFHINAAITAFLAAARERGLKLVGREASEGMWNAGARGPLDGRKVDRIWSDMWDAAPEVKP